MEDLWCASYLATFSVKLVTPIAMFAPVWASNAKRLQRKHLIRANKQSCASTQALAKHLRYIKRDGAARDGEPGWVYGPQTDLAFKERADDDRHHFRFMVSPEEGAELDDLRGWIGWR